MYAYMYMYMYMYDIQWNPSIPDTLGTAWNALIKGGVLISGVVLYTVLQYVAGTMHGVLIKGGMLDVLQLIKGGVLISGASL
jgi:hypothetical protein